MEGIIIAYHYEKEPTLKRLPTVRFQLYNILEGETAAQLKASDCQGAGGGGLTDGAQRILRQ